MSGTDIYYLARRKLSRVTLFGKWKYTIPLFCFFAALILIANVFYSIFDLARSHFINPPRNLDQSIVYVKNADPDEPLKNADVESIRKIKGVRAAQGIFYVTKDHYFSLSMVILHQPTLLAGFDREFFDLYNKLPADKRDPNSIPVVLDEEIFRFSYEAEEGKFHKQPQSAMREMLGRVIELNVAPLCNTLYFPDWKEESHILLDPIELEKYMANLQQKAVLDFETFKPNLAGYCRPLRLRLQIVGYVSDKLAVGNPYGSRTFGILPLERAKIIYEMLDMRQKSGAGNNIARGLEPNVIYVLPDQGKGGEVIKAIRSMGLNATLYSEEAKRHAPEFDASDLVIMYFFLLIYFAVVFVGIYMLLGATVKDAVKEIGVMRCIGATKADIRRVFMYLNVYQVMRVLFYALIFSYAILIFAGHKTASYMNALPLRMVADKDSGAMGEILVALAEHTEHVSSLWMIAPIRIQAFILSFFILLAMVSALLPTRKASRIDPSEALRD